MTKESLGGYELTIIDGGSKNSYCTIQINEWISEVTYDSVKKGQIKYPYHPSIYSKGYIGEGEAVIWANGKNTKVYDVWHDMIKRVYDPKVHIKQPAYKGVKLCEEWHNFNTFALWFKDNYIDGYALDKDLLSGGSKIYSPDTCVFIPVALNSFLANIKSTNTSGHTGVCWHKRRNKWNSNIRNLKINKIISLGYFSNIEEASKAYQKKRAVYVRYWKYVAKRVYNLPQNAIDNIK